MGLWGQRMNFTNFSYLNLSHTVSVRDMVNLYCTRINHNLIILIGVVALMWLIQPIVFKAFDKVNPESHFLREIISPSSLKMIYKWLGIGILFMVGYSMTLL